MGNKPIYLDTAATTLIDPRVKKAMLPYFDELFGNASSKHYYGKKAKLAITVAREHAANIINATPKEIFFTSGATEAINWALKGFIERNPEKGNHIITVKTEHKAVLNTCKYLENKGIEVTYLDVNENGLISLDELKAAIKANTAMIAIMYVNNEIGVIQDIKSIGEIAYENDICFFCDATQAIGKVHLDVSTYQIDMLCFSAHKFNGPKGVGVLYKKSGVKLECLMHGGSQENGDRGGTSNTPGIVGLGEACRIAQEEFESNIKSLLSKKADLEKYYVANNIGQINFKEVATAPHILSITLKDYEAEEFLMAKSKEFAASTGSACNSNLIEESHVLIALGKSDRRTIRISL